ncbi:sigma-70 family RNA polymerase sigma factor [Oerskovia enterophila]|uniref:RNA polymerase sigma-E factor n=1 Tax=Oerskovia enterophila TaxID=43678 RepID=A0A161YHQ8_9CELL|nr:sigma-70 family RNA polymerase sigma factor [Oerskovia enterophila]KZM35678.1 RNA polymerase sigma-E factor [Oerskovia enterophila]OCI29561.1 RNA polymerase sigma-E factor [Oerskovia enterophila]
MARWEQVLDEIVRTRRRALVGYAYLLCGDLREAEDLVQEGLVRTFRRGRAATDFQLAESYVRKAILTTYLDGFRRRRHWEGIRHLFDEPDGPDTPSATDARLDVQKALMTLSPRERACVVLRFYSDLTVRQVADQLSLSEGTVKRYLSDANSKLAACLGPIDTPSDDLDVTPQGGAR